MKYILLVRFQYELRKFSVFSFFLPWAGLETSGRTLETPEVVYYNLMNE